MSLNTSTHVRPTVPVDEVIYTQTPIDFGKLMQEAPLDDSWEHATQEEALPNAGSAVSVQIDSTSQNSSSAAAAAEKMSAPIPSDASSSEEPATPSFALQCSVFCAVTTVATAASGALMTLLALNQLPRNDGSHQPKPGEFGTSVTLAVGFFATAVAATGTAIACGMRYFRERDSQAAAEATV